LGAGRKKTFEPRLGKDLRKGKEKVFIQVQKNADFLTVLTCWLSGGSKVCEFAHLIGSK